MQPAGDITYLLRRWREGNGSAENDLIARVLPNLRRLAHYLMKRERKGQKPPTESTNPTSKWSLPKIGIGGIGIIFSLLLLEPCEGT